MTTIIAVETEKDVTFGWDSQITWRGRGMAGATKVFENGPVIFGVAGASRGLDILKHMSIPDRREYEPEFDNERWIVTKLVPAIVEEFKDVHAAEPGQFDSETNVIICVGGQVGYLSSNMSWVRDESGVYGIGSGSNYALGALAAGAKVQEAVEIAAQFDLGTGGTVKTRKVKK